MMSFERYALKTFNITAVSKKLLTIEQNEQLNSQYLNYVRCYRLKNKHSSKYD